MSSDKATKSMWLRFFRDAGIPQGFDTKYALVFDENRIKHDMLMDISKECLKDMGITAMGDIIAILKHAKIVYEESKAQAYDIPQPTSTVRLSAPAPAPKSSSPASSGSSCGSTESREPRSVIINSQHKVFATQPSKVPSTAAARSKTQTDAPVNRTISRLVPSSSSSMLVSTSSDRKTEPGVKATLMATSKIVKPTPSTIVRLKRSVSPAQREEVPLQKKTRVLKEQEGSYIVKMPEGTTPKTQKLMQDRLGPINNTHVQMTEKKLSVFSRLGGESRVSSSSDVSPKEQVKTKSSVFSRLGQGSTSTASSSQQQQQVIARPSIDPSDFLKTRFEVRQAISSPALNIAKAHLASNYNTNNSNSLGRLVSDRGSVCSLEPRNDNRISSTGSRMRSSADGGSVKSRLGSREINSTTAISRSRSRSISPPPKRQFNDPRIQIRRGVVERRPSPATQFSTTIKPRIPVQVITKPQAQTAIRKMDPDNSELSVSRQVVREERFKNAEGKNMIRKTVIKTVRKRI
ncbi:uncharacterized protein C19orf47 isoform X2 [Folsomia candida]|uniref:uncharacterized protein C19orf47 isoform X2 n=1 Tax=Folsomia candida TaxID=158441 RepID=UPI000B8F2E38|nr:uncharacterized protein C19orf47 isoform X2 [Folsomia candida]